MRVAVVGHVEWVRFAVVDRLPGAGEIVHASETFEVAGGGGGVAAVQLSRLAGSCLFLAAVGDDDQGRRAVADLRERAWTFVPPPAARRSGWPLRTSTRRPSGQSP